MSLTAQVPRTGPKEGTPWVHAQRQDHKLVRLRPGCSHTSVHASPRLGTAQESPRQAGARASGQTSLLTAGGSHASQPHEERAQSDPSQDPRTQLHRCWGSWRPRPPPSKGPAWGRVNAAFTPAVCAPSETSALAPVDETPPHRAQGRWPGQAAAAPPTPPSPLVALMGDWPEPLRCQGGTRQQE